MLTLDAMAIMKGFVQFWGNRTISQKLNFVVGAMALLIVGELVTLRFAMNKLSASRSLVSGESMWSKAQKDAVSSLQRFQVTKNESDFTAFNDHFKIIKGDSQARQELSKPEPDLSVVIAGFKQGGIHEDDIPGIINLLQRFHRISYIARAIEYWGEADSLVEELISEANRYKDAVKNGRFSAGKQILARVDAINAKLTIAETGFSESIGAGCRWLEHLVLALLTMIVLTVETIGLSLAFVTNRSISKRLAQLQWLTSELSKGNFNQVVRDDSRDEIGNLVRSVNQMGSTLESSYRDLENKVRERTQEATEAVHMRDEFLQIASHELRTPLTSLSLELQFLARKLEKLEPSHIRSESLELSQKSLHGVNRLTLLMDELLDLTRIQSGKFEVHCVQNDLIPLLHDCVSKFALQASQHGAKITLNTPPRLFAYFDPIRIEQVVTNLISNALKYGGGTPIDISAAARNASVTICVKDQGPGIPRDKQDKIFSRFERVESNPNVKGLGLGLYITRQIIEAHGGHIDVKSDLNEGAAFTIHLLSKVTSNSPGLHLNRPTEVGDLPHQSPGIPFA